MKLRRVSWRMVIIAAVSVLPLAAACSGASNTGTQASSSGAPGVSPVDSASTAGLTKGLVLPLEAYMENDTQRLALENAHLALESKCMARYGFTTPSQVTHPAPAPGFDASNMQRRYGVSDPGLAQRYGYHLSTPLPTANPTGELLSPEGKEVLSGRTRDASGAFVPVTKFAGQAVPPGGCFGAASRAIGDAAMDTSLPERLDAESLDRSTADPRVQAALSKWSQCMAGKGYHAASPEAMDQVVPYTTTAVATQTEIQIAMADVNCKKSTGLIATWFAVETGVQNTMVDQNQLALNAERQQLNAAIKKAASLVG